MADKHLNDVGTKNRMIWLNTRRLILTIVDIMILSAVNVCVLLVYPSSSIKLSAYVTLLHMLVSLVCILLSRIFFDVYKQVWRYGNSSSYIHLIFADILGGALYFAIQSLTALPAITFLHTFAVVALNLLLTISSRLVYQYLYELPDRKTDMSDRLEKVIRWIANDHAKPITDTQPVVEVSKIKIAIVGAGRVGVMLAEELLNNPHTSYYPCCFIEINRAKIGRIIHGIPVIASDMVTAEKLAEFQVQEIVFALPQAAPEQRKELYEHYKKTGCKIKNYDYPVMKTAENGKRHLREFDIQELLFRQPVEFHDEKTSAYYKDKVILITGGGGSIGSELCRQVAKMQPKKLVILDVYENGAYDVQQELRIAYGNKLNLQVEIVSVCDRAGFSKIFEEHRPDILIHAAAHKHVPLMERNCCEAIKNNVFGTLNAVELAEKYHVGRFMMVSTDKAVNPTNVMGATKRMCEMIVQSHSNSGSDTVFSATRFGNVLGSAGSVIPLFKKQIINGGPVTLTDRRIIRYFMTIPEASQLVLQSGAMAKNGELFVLDMGKPVKILELAENMIKLSGYEPYKDIQIIETGLRPGEKLYEEILIRTEELDKTDNSMIYIERDMPLSIDVILQKLAVLREAVLSEDDVVAKKALKSVVPTFFTPEEVNRSALNAQEMKMVGSTGKTEQHDVVVL